MKKSTVFLVHIFLIHLLLTIIPSTIFGNFLDNSDRNNIISNESADECEDVTAAQTFNPITAQDFDLDYNCLMGCLDLANPDPTFTGCGEFADNPAVWYKVEVDEDAAQLYTTVQAIDNFNPVWSIYGGDDCSALELLYSDGLSCSSADNTPELFNVAVIPEYTTYWVLVGVEDGYVELGDFEICVATVINAIVCLGEQNGGCEEPSLVMEVIDRENDQPLDPDGDGLAGPFCAGEEITINVEFFYDASETGQDWFQGLVPKFGPGWDIENFDFAANAPIGNSQTALWYEEGSATAPLITEDVPHLCTYIDVNGNLALCNNLCENCNDCPSPGMESNDPLPSGYFWVSTADESSTCTNDGSPSTGWGIGSQVASIAWEFSIRTKSFSENIECEVNDDLQISFQSFAHSLSGCWDDPVGECLIDKAQFSPLWKVDCLLPPTIIAEDATICTSEATSISVTTSDFSNTNITVIATDNPNVTGETDYTFPLGSGIITDFLSNETNVNQIVTYSMYADDPSLACTGLVKTIEVTVLPELIASFSPDLSLCEGECIDISPSISGGTGGPYFYTWSTGQNSTTITVCPTFPTIYEVTVTDDLNCTSLPATAEIEVYPEVHIEMDDFMTVCPDDSFDPFNPQYVVCPDVTSGNQPFTFEWNSTPQGLEGSPTGIFNECFAINETATNIFNGPYTLGANITSADGCQGYEEITINVLPEFVFSVDIVYSGCGDSIAFVTVIAIMNDGNPVDSYLEYVDCNDDFSVELFTVSPYVFEVPIEDDTICIKVGANFANCIGEEIIEIFPLQKDLPSISGTTSICEGDPATLIVDNADLFESFIWNPDVGNSEQVFITPLQTTIYTVTAIDFAGCETMTSATVTVLDGESALCADPCENQTTNYQIAGTAYSDENGNGMQDSLEFPLPNVLITNVDSNFSVFTNLLGEYILPLDVSTVNLEANISEGSWADSTLEILNLSLDVPCLTGVDFGFNPNPQSLKGKITVNNSIVRCDWETRFYITVENQDNIPLNGEVSFHFDPLSSYVSSNAPDIIIVGDNASFETGTLAPYQPTTFLVTLKMPPGSGLLPMLDFRAEFFGGSTLLDGYEFKEQLLCSYDPNDKRTNPARDGEENFTLIEETLKYNLRFQNSGNDTAFHVRLVDTLDPNIDLNSIRFTNASHTYTACLDEQILIIDFPNINLVDSTSNYDASQGFINFNCKIKENTALGTVINNTVDIYFDSNAPIKTNTTINTIAEIICPTLITTIDVQICDGEEYEGNTESGIYETIYTNAEGCDSIKETHLTVIEAIDIMIEGTVCKGDTFEYEGEPYVFETSGNYTFEEIGSSGCIEMINHFTIDVIEATTLEFDITLCQGDSFNYEEHTFEIEESGEYEFDLIGESGCIETILDVDATVISTQEEFHEATICLGDTIVIDGEILTSEESGTYTIEIYGEQGCLETLHTVDLIVLIPVKTDINLSICEGVLVEYEGVEYAFDSTGLYTFETFDEQGCLAQVLLFDVNVTDNILITTDTIICEGMDYQGLTTTGTYELESVDDETGCLIIENVNLTVLPISDPHCTVNTIDASSGTIEAFPIPSNDKITIKSSEEMIGLSCYSSTGVLMYQSTNVSKTIYTLNVRDFTPGLYFLVVETEQGRMVKKVIRG